MKKLLLLAALTIGLSAGAQDYKGHYGIGFAVGEPIGVSIKKFNDNQAFQYTLGYSLISGKEGLNLGTDYLLHDYSFISAEKGKVPIYYGVGIHFRSYSNTGTQVYTRIPLGIAYEVSEYPVDLFFEFAPGFSLLRTSVEEEMIIMNFGIGGRFYFDVKRAVEKLDEAI